jgi:hypothetical protein
MATRRLMFAKNLGGSSWLQRGLVRTILEQTYDPQVPASDALNAKLQQFAPIAMGGEFGITWIAILGCRSRCAAGELPHPRYVPCLRD